MLYMEKIREWKSKGKDLCCVLEGKFRKIWVELEFPREKKYSNRTEVCDNELGGLIPH